TSTAGRPEGSAGPAAGFEAHLPPAPAAAVAPRAPQDRQPQDRQEPDTHGPSDTRGPSDTPVASPSGSLLVVDLTPAVDSRRSPAATTSLVPSGE
ncbi:hypothetical protein ND748_32990, partial [Frankia sp. AiPs1]